MSGRDEHRRFLNRYYGTTRRVYDATRAFYLLGRDRLLASLLEEPWERLVEIGPGTGRNLRRLHASRPDARLAGVDASDAMLEHARPRCPFARLEHGFAEDADLVELLGTPPDRILFSYSLSMITDPAAALANARRSLAPGGRVAIVDFADLAGLPALAATAFNRFLASFHVVTPLAVLEHASAPVRFGPLRYYVIAELSSLGTAAADPHARL